jgi:peptide/nickel transport system permease protein
MVGLVSMGIAALIGIILGALAGFFGDNKLQMPRIKYWMTLSGLFMGIFYGFGQRKYILSDAFGTSISNGILQTLISVIIIFGTIFLFRKLSLLLKFRYLKDETNIPIDTFVSRGIELLNSIPRLLLIITITAVVERSIWIVMIIIGLTSWTGIARFTRAEFLRIRSLEFVQAAESLGFSSVRTIFKHALPNALAPVFVSIAFGIASAILIESGLSFLGIGVPTDIVTWGSLLNLGRQNLEAWWLIIYPGMAIFITITIYNMIAEASRDALDPKLKS